MWTSRSIERQSSGSKLASMVMLLVLFYSWPSFERLSFCALIFRILLITLAYYHVQSRLSIFFINVFFSFAYFVIMLGSYHLIAQSRKHLNQIPHSMTCDKIMREFERNERLFRSSRAPFLLCFPLNTEENM